MKKPVLKPCPFCGAKPKLKNASNQRNQYWIECENENCISNYGKFWGKKDAIKKWNKRIP